MMKELIEELTNDRDYLISEISGTIDYEQLISYGARLGEVNRMIYKLTEVHIQQGINIREKEQYLESRDRVITGLNEKIYSLKNDNHLMQLFIEDNVSDEKKKEIFND